MPKGGTVIFKIDRLTKAVDKSVEDAVKRAAYNIMKEAKQIAEQKKIFDTGRLIGSITVNWQGSGMQRGKVESPATSEDGVGQPKPELKQFKAVVGTNVHYAPRHEFGTSQMRARPYLRPAFEARKKDLEKELRRIK